MYSVLKEQLFDEITSLLQNKAFKIIEILLILLLLCT